MTQKPFVYSGVQGSLNQGTQPTSPVVSNTTSNQTNQTPFTMGFSLQDVQQYEANKPAPGLADLNSRIGATSSSIAMPGLAVYQPDYGGLEASFNKIMESFNAYKQAAESQFGAQKSSLDLNLENQLKSVEKAKETTEKQYGKGRQQLAEDVFMTSRQTQNALSARGLSGSGVEALANIQNRMAAGEAISNMANQFFEAQTQLVEAEQTARQSYDVSLQGLNSSLQATMAQIMNQEASTQMGYTQQIESLKRQVVADTNAVKQFESQWKMAQSQLHEGQKITNTMIQTVLASGGNTENRVGGLKDLGYSEAEARAEILRYDNATQSEMRTQQTNMYKDVAQMHIDNRLSQNMSVAKIKKELDELYGPNLDHDVLRFTPASSSTSGQFEANKGLPALMKSRDEQIKSYVDMGYPYEIALRMVTTGTKPGQR